MKRLSFLGVFLFLFFWSGQVYADMAPLPSNSVSVGEYTNNKSPEIYTTCTFNPKKQTMITCKTVPENPAFTGMLFNYHNQWYQPDVTEFVVHRDEDNKNVYFKNSILSEFDSISVVWFLCDWLEQKDAGLGIDVSNKIVNGDFEAGNTGFTSAYTYVMPQSSALQNSSPNKYTVDVGLKWNHATLSTCVKDHTSKEGNFFIALGKPEDNTIVWQQTVETFPSALKQFAFSAWVLNWGDATAQPVGLQWYIDGEPIGDVEYTNSGNCTWKRIGTLWENTENKSSIEVSLRTKGTKSNGGLLHIGLDDVRFGPINYRTRVTKSYYGEYVTLTDTLDLELCPSDATTLEELLGYFEKKYGYEKSTLHYVLNSVKSVLKNGGTMLISHGHINKGFNQPWERCENKHFDKCFRIKYAGQKIPTRTYPLTLCYTNKSVACPWTSNKYKSFKESGLYIDTFRNEKGCDTAYYVAEVTRSPKPKQILKDTSVCLTYYVFGNNNYKEINKKFTWAFDGHEEEFERPDDKYELTKQFTVPDMHGCDSIYYFLTAHWRDASKDNISEDIFLCPSETIYRFVDTGYVTIDHIGTYTIDLTTQQEKWTSCGKKWTFNVKGTTKEIMYRDTLAKVCPGDDYTWYPYGNKKINGRVISRAFKNVRQSSDYYDTLRSVYGCDSVISHLWLHTIYPFDTVVKETICAIQLPATYHIKIKKQEKYNTLAGESSLNNSWELYAPLRSTKRTDTTYEFVFKEEGRECEAYRFYLNLHVIQSKIIKCRDTIVPFGSVMKWVPNPDQPEIYEEFKVTKPAELRNFIVPYKNPAYVKFACDSVHYQMNIITTYGLPVIPQEATICNGASYEWQRASYVPKRTITPDDYGPYLRHQNVFEYLDTVRYVKSPDVDSAYYTLKLTIQQGEDVPTKYDTICEGANYSWQKGNKVVYLSEPVLHPFTINDEGGKVLLAPGNLQYCPERDIWRFAERPFDRCGVGGDESTVYWSKEGTTVKCNNKERSKDYGGWLDMFMWATSGHGEQVGDKYAKWFYPYEYVAWSSGKEVNEQYNLYGIGPSVDPNYDGSSGVWGEGAKSCNIDKYSGTNQYFDWGYANSIQEGGKTHKPGRWRTLTADEWHYIIHKRAHAYSYVRLKFGSNSTDTVTGIVLYPDNFSFSEAGIDSISVGKGKKVPYKNYDHITTYEYPLTEIEDMSIWSALEQAGCIFMPCYAYGIESKGIWSTDLPYWTSTADKITAAAQNDLVGAALATYFKVIGEDVSPYTWWGFRNYTFPVRLGRDVGDIDITEEVVPDELTLTPTESEMDYYDTVWSSVGCDSLRYHLHLVLQKPRSEEKDTVLCYNDTTFKWHTWRDTILRPKYGWNTYYDTSKTSRGCDGVYYKLRIFRRNRITVEERVPVCAYDALYKWKTSDPANPIPLAVPEKDSTYYDYVSYSDGKCDSVEYILHMRVIKPEVQDTTEATVCGANEYAWKTSNPNYAIMIKPVSADTFYRDTLKSVSGCDSIYYTLHLKAKTVSVRDTLYDTICGPGSYDWERGDGLPKKTVTPYKQNHIYRDTLRYDNGCDSVYYTLSLCRLLTQEDYRTDTICETDHAYEWYTEDGTFVKRLTPTDEPYKEYKESIPYSFTTLCDSVLCYLDLYRLYVETDTTYDTICNKTTYEWKRQVEMEEIKIRDIVQTTPYEIYHDTIRSANTGCDSMIFVLHLTRLETRPEKQEKTLCVGETFDWYTNDKDNVHRNVGAHTQQSFDTTYMHRIPFSNCETCDSVAYELRLILSQVDNCEPTRTLCYNETYDWYTSDASKPRYTIRAEDIEGTDTTFRDTLFNATDPNANVYYSLKVTVHHRETFTRTDTVSIDSLYRWYTNDPTKASRNIQPKEEGLETYTYPVYHLNGCEIEHYTLNLLCQTYKRDTIVDTVCAGSTYYWTPPYEGAKTKEINQTENEKFYYDTAHYVGTKHIDSVRYVLHLFRQTIRSVREDTDYVCASDVTYDWKAVGKEVSIELTEKEHDYADTLRYTGTKACDSMIYNLHLIRLDYEEKPLTARVCFGEIYSWKTEREVLLDKINQRQQYKEYKKVIPYTQHKNCDSVHYTLALNVDTVILESVEGTFCKDETYVWAEANNREIKQTTDAQYHQYLKRSKMGCDSIYYTLHLTRLYPSDSILDTVICYGKSIEWYGLTYNESTTQTLRFKNSVGCDSTCVLNLTVCPEAKVVTLKDTIICPNHIVDWYGQILEKTGDYEHRVKNIYGCDSIIYKLHAVEKDTSLHHVDDVVLYCYQNLPYIWHYRYCYGAGTYYDTLTNQQGCDSICVLNLSVSDVIDFRFTDTLLCVDRSITWHDSIVITEKGVYYDTVWNMGGCDSIYYILNVDTHDCCKHLVDLKWSIQKDVCADDTFFNYIFQYSQGLPDSFNVRFTNPKDLDKYAAFRDTAGHFALEHVSATLSSLPIRIPQRTPYIRPTGYRVEIDITDTCGTRYQYHVKDSIYVYYPSWIIDQHWNDVLALLNPDYNGGYEFSDYQWYQDGSPIYDAIRDHYYFPANLSINSEYKALVTRKDDGYTTYTCPVIIQHFADESVLKDHYIYIHPSIVPKEKPIIQIVSNLKGNYWIYDMAGKVLLSGEFASYDEIKAATEVTLPAVQGAYFIYLLPTDRRLIKNRSSVMMVR